MNTASQLQPHNEDDSPIENRRNLLNRLKNSNTESMKESEKHKVGIEKREAEASANNRIVSAKFLLTLIFIMAGAATLFAIMIAASYTYQVISDADKTEAAFLSMYKAVSSLIEKHQSVIAVIFTLIFGDKIRSIAKPKEDNH